MTSTRHITTHGLDRPNHLAQLDTGLQIAHPLLWLLPFCEAPNVLRSSLQRSAKLRGDLLPSLVDLRLSDTKCVAGNSVEFAAVAKQCCIAVLLYISDDLCDGLLHTSKIKRTAILESLEHGSPVFAGDEFHSFISLTSRSCSGDTRQYRWHSHPSALATHRARRSLQESYLPQPNHGRLAQILSDCSAPAAQQARC